MSGPAEPQPGTGKAAGKAEAEGNALEASAPRRIVGTVEPRHAGSGDENELGDPLHCSICRVSERMA